MYIHLPFCVRKCPYCDFVSYAGREDRIPAYFEALTRELEGYIRQGIFREYTAATLYVGGGTPSLATDELLAFLRQHPAIFAAESLREKTIEINPGTASGSTFQQLYHGGFNRVSVGVQSFHETELTALGRIHTRDDAIACLHAARDAGFQNISLDLIFGLPDADVAAWNSSLAQAIAFKPEHISTYNLTLEEDTLFWKQAQAGTFDLPDEETQLALYETAIATLAATGYEQYEISNFARPGYRSQHNQIYWSNEEYLGLGAAAHSYLHGRRWWNHRNLETYITGGSHVAGEERLTKRATIGETMMMNLRVLEGVSITAFQQRFGQSIDSVYAETLPKLCSLGLLERRGDRLRLTPRGVLLSNEIFREFLLD